METHDSSAQDGKAKSVSQRRSVEKSFGDLPKQIKFAEENEAVCPCHFGGSASTHRDLRIKT